MPSSEEIHGKIRLNKNHVSKRFLVASNRPKFCFCLFKNLLSYISMKKRWNREVFPALIQKFRLNQTLLTNKSKQIFFSFFKSNDRNLKCFVFLYKNQLNILIGMKRRCSRKVARLSLPHPLHLTVLADLGLMVAASLIFIVLN